MQNDLPASIKLSMSLLTVAMSAATVLAVVAVSQLSAISLFGALVAVTGLRMAFTLASIWVPRGQRENGTPGQSSGDRFPRYPFPRSPSRVGSRPLPGS